MPENQPPKLAFLTSARILGGAEIRLKSLVTGLGERGIQSILVAPAETPVSDWARSAGLTHVPFDLRGLRETSLLSTAQYLLSFRRLVRKLKTEHGVDVLYSNSRHAFTTLAFAPRDVARIAHHRDARSSRVNAFLYPLIDLNIFISQFNYHASDAPRNAIIVKNAIDLVEPRRPAPYRGGTLRMAMFARITAYKGHEIALQAVRGLIEQGVDCSLDLWGEPSNAVDGLLLQTLNEIVNRDRLPVRFMGLTDDARKRMVNYDLILNPSLNEPFGTVPVEGFNVGVPVLSHASGGPLEIYPPDLAPFFLFDDHSGASLARKIMDFKKRIIEGEEMLDSITAMQEHVSNAFSNARVFSEVEQAIISTVRGRKR
jgi:glycosyltransferase involved in cell wall biosynthesis